MRAIEIVGSNAKGDDIIPFFVEVELAGDSFLQIKESLMRIGLPGQPNAIDGFPTLHQTCHILSKLGRYYICHYKSLFILDGKENTLTRSDIARQNTIINLLQEWGLLKVVNQEQIVDPVCSLRTLKVVKYKDRNEWKFVSRYDVGSSVRLNRCAEQAALRR
jgi:hypothetical protein